MTTFAAGKFGVDFDILDLAPLGGATPLDRSATFAGLHTGDTVASLSGYDFTFEAAGPPVSGTINGIVLETADGALIANIQGLGLPAALFRDWVAQGDNATAKFVLFAGADTIVGSALDDRLRGYDGSDTMSGGAGDDFLDGGAGEDTVFGGGGEDVLVDPEGQNVLRGDAGDDLIVGGVGFDDANGNIGDDTVMTGPGDDYCVGGKDNDQLFGDDGADFVYGNLGNDTCSGGDGADIVRGGQGDDTLLGGEGADFVSGDRGDDTMVGGGGADIYHSSSDAGVDRVLDFAQGDRVQLDPGTAFTISQVGADTVIQMSAGQVILVGVTLSSLAADAVFVG